MSALVIALLVGVATYFLFMIAFPKAAPEDKDANIRAAMEQLYEENRAQELSPQEILRDKSSGESALVRTILGHPAMRRVYEAGLQAGYQENLQGLLVSMLMTGAIILLLFMLMGNALLGLVVAIPGAYYLTLNRCKSRIRKRNGKFIDNFPDALDMIVRSVRSGFPLSTTLQMLSENAEEPVRTEFRQVVDDLALGRSLGEAMSRLGQRVNEPDVRFFVVVLAVQQETGGNLSEIVGNLSNVLRKRKQLRHKIKAMTSEGRATGIVLGLLPVAIFGALTVVQPEYLEPFFNDPLGNILLGAVGVLMAICFVVVKQMIKIDI